MSRIAARFSRVIALSGLLAAAALVSLQDTEAQQNTEVSDLSASAAGAAAGTLAAPAEAPAGSTIEVGWAGAADPTDFISIDQPGAPDRTYGASYGYPARTGTLKLLVPDVPGEYTIRYHAGSTYAVTASANLNVTDVSATLSAPEAVASGDALPVSWTGPGYPRDFISIDEAGAVDRVYGKYAYTSDGNPLTLRVLVPAGDYVIRYHLASTYRVIGSAPLRVTDIAATLDAPAQIDAGAEVSVSWTGPDNPGDFVSIDKPGAPDRIYGKYVGTKAGNPAKIRAPDEAGDYVIRYHLSETYRVIGSAPLRVGGVDATLEAPPAVPAGGTVPVTWTGPGHPRDFVSIDAPGAADRKYGAYEYTAKGAVLSIVAPDEPGDYVLRYHTGESYKVLVTRELRVEPTTATVSPPAQAVAGRVFDVGWSGPDNPSDFLTVVAPAAADREAGSHNAYTKRGNPARIEAPRTPGDYEVRYLTGQTRRALARAPLRIVPDATPGTLAVRTAGRRVAATFGAVELVLDASGSMLQRLDGQRRIDLAKHALIDLTRDVVPANTPLALRVFGHKEADSCRTDLEIPLAPLDVAGAVARIESIESQNLAKTPIGDSLVKVRSDLAGVISNPAGASGPVLVVLVTDGEETCDGDPHAAIEGLRKSGIEVRVNIVGFAIDDVELKETFQMWARAGGGGYFDAHNASELNAAVRATFRTTYEVLQQDAVIATGIVDGDPIEIPSGSYRVRLHGDSERDLNEVTVAPGALHTLDL